MKLKIKVAMMGHKVDEIIDIADKNGIPKDKFWRNRVADSALDGCVEIVDNRKKSKQEKSDATSKA